MPVTMAAARRLKLDLMRLKKDPVPYIVAVPLPSNILEWHYVITGPEESPFHGGVYHGRIMFPDNFPFKPPAIYMDTPNGRFAVNTRLCLTMSDFHPETWNPAWSTTSILTGLLSFMLEDKIGHIGGIRTTSYEKNQLAKLSHKNNLKDNVFCELFPEHACKAREVLTKNIGDESFSKYFNEDGQVVEEVADRDKGDCTLNDNVETEEPEDIAEMGEVAGVEIENRTEETKEVTPEKPCTYKIIDASEDAGVVAGTQTCNCPTEDDANQEDEKDDVETVSLSACQ